MASFKRASLKALGLNDDQIDAVIELHTEVTDGLKEKVKELQEKADKFDEAQTKINQLEKDAKKYEEEHSAFEAFKKSVTEKETAAAKTKAGESYLESKGIKGGNLKIAMMAAKDAISSLELDGEKIKDTKALDDLVESTLKGLIVSESTKGADPINPPAGGGSVLKSRAEIYAKDEKGRYKMDAIQRQQELAKLEASGKE